MSSTRVCVRRSSVTIRAGQLNTNPDKYKNVKTVSCSKTLQCQGLFLFLKMYMARQHPKIRIKPDKERANVCCKQCNIATSWLYSRISNILNRRPESFYLYLINKQVIFWLMTTHQNEPKLGLFFLQEHSGHCYVLKTDVWNASSYTSWYLSAVSGFEIHF